MFGTDRTREASPPPADGDHRRVRAVLYYLGI
jgi:hypothetical protein